MHTGHNMEMALGTEQTPAFPHEQSTVVYSAGSFGLNNRGKPCFDQLFVKGSIVHRECADCAASHKNIYYLRVTDVPSELSAYDVFLENWFDRYNNKLNVDFRLYSSLPDLRNDRNRWNACNFNDAGVGFPRDCGPTGQIGHQWNSILRDGGQANVKYTVIWVHSVNLVDIQCASHKHPDNDGEQEERWRGQWTWAHLSPWRDEEDGQDDYEEEWEMEDYGQVEDGMDFEIIWDEEEYAICSEEVHVPVLFEPGSQGTITDTNKANGTVKVEAVSNTTNNNKDWVVNKTEGWVPIKAIAGFEKWPKVGEAVAAKRLWEPTTWIKSGCHRAASELATFIEQTSITKVDMTLYKCFAHCKKQAAMKFFSVTKGSTCFCSPNLPGGKIDAALCDMKCPVAPTESCGGVASAASVYSMVDCTPASPQEVARAQRAKMIFAYAIVGPGSCGDDKKALCELNGSSFLSGTVDECKIACWEAKGAVACHGFTYDDEKSECTFHTDVTSGKAKQKKGLRCFFKRLGGQSKEPKAFPWSTWD